MYSTAVDVILEGASCLRMNVYKQPSWNKDQWSSPEIAIL